MEHAVVAHVEHAPGWQRSLCRPLAQAVPAVTAVDGVLERLQRRGRTTQNDRHAQLRSPLHRHVAGGIAEAVLLLERGVVLLVEDDEAGSRQGDKQGRARADHERGVPGARGGPGLQPLTGRQPRVNDRGLQAEPLAKASQQLRGQADFGHQHQGLAAGLQHGLQQPQVNLGFAAAGHPVEQVAAEAAEVGGDRRHGSLLVGRQVRPGAWFGSIRRRRLAVGPTVVQQRAERLAPLAADGGERVGAARRGGQGLQHGVLYGRPARPLRQALHTVSGDAELQRRIRQCCIHAAQGGRQRPRDDLSGRMLVVLPAPAQQVQQVAVQDGLVVIQHGRHAQQAIRRHPRLAAVPGHHAQQPAAPERDHDPAADDRQRTTAWRQVIEELRQGNRQRDLDEGGIGHSAEF